MFIGSHLSISKGFVETVKQAIKMEANTFQFFTRNPRGGKARKLDIDDFKKADELCEEYNFASLLAHAPYTYNFASDNDKTWEFAKTRLKDDLYRLQHLNCCKYIVIHPGNHLKKGIDFGIERIAEAINEVLDGNENTMILLETMSGKGTEVGFKFEQLKEIIDRVEHNKLMGVCFDTCHTYSAGYNIKNDLEGVLEEFDKTLGLDRLKAIHLNDSMHELGSRKDRHARIGEGTLGLEGILNFINHPKLKNIPLYLETPNDIEGYIKEIKIIRYGYLG
ncbi:Endonuclease IV [Caminicella sporogenes DSM 14501]|uniref:Probable endonuclease 4 n=1 Tax=Caminicella sporogenes DSM 14501 TaxID=1121266 RepID=A0A1M6MVA1_9FIRM|nr:deoxyribonuclease IV [Caminicella sporogenes]RKD22487.1 endonuclease IV [Caminicella sporogenes]SHJ87352.1 Endonuclease IV [Caminicella sporogenes DSM 14501]